MIFYQLKNLQKPNGVLLMYKDKYIFFYINQAKTYCTDINIGVAKNYRKKIDKPNVGIPDDFPKRSMIDMIFKRDWQFEKEL